ncbi:MAG: acetyl-CoA carboxylase carboxyl transferase subunit alpha [Christensenellaceae bacterium]|nr:acetyl-CoA carboxylase carboxyl transferase subunit alpha [Christensenellaceae bacterium]
MTAYEKLKTVRASTRPTGRDFVEALFTDRVELCGDRRFADDPAIIGGIGYLGGHAVTYVAIDKGKDLDERMKKHFGCPMPEGYRKALRLMKQAEKFNRPVICLVDTLGAFCGADGEERGQGQAIAENLYEMMGLKTPIISVVLGEGGSGGALALAVADRVYMLQNAVYSVITPDGCASIIWKDAARVQDAADCLHITAHDMLDFGVAEEIIREDFENFDRMCSEMKELMLRDLGTLCGLSVPQLLDERYNRFRRIGVYEENGSAVK